MKVILFEDLKGHSPERTSEQLVQIVANTQPDLILRAASRHTYESLSRTWFERLKTNISAIKSRFPNTLIIGNVYWQVIGKAEKDDITGETYTSEYMYDNTAFDPSEYGVTGITKCEYQCCNDINICAPCECKGPGEAQSGRRWIPDITKPLTQQLFIHQIQKLLETGVDGVWIDGNIFTANYLISKFSVPTDEQKAKIQMCIDASLKICEDIRVLRTLSNKIPLISSWYRKSETTEYYENSIYWYPKFFDFVTLYYPGVNEIKMISPLQNYDEIKNNVINHYGNVPIIAYIDWSFGKHQSWYFAQWYPEFTSCCAARDSINTRDKRNKFQKEVLKFFSEFFNIKGIDFAYPIHGMPMCKTSYICNEESDTIGPCCVKAYGKYHIYDAQAPEFNTYNEIVRLINQTPSVQPSEFGINKFIMVGLASGLLYALLKKDESKNKK